MVMLAGIFGLEIFCHFARESFFDKKFYCLESVTYVPYQTKLIEVSLLSIAEMDWIDAYNKECWNKLSPLLAEDSLSLKYLERECRPLVRQ